jgi:hypothetical protein
LNQWDHLNRNLQYLGATIQNRSSHNILLPPRY